MSHGFALFALMLVASAASAALTYKAACTGAAIVPPVTTKATGSVSLTLISKTYASGYFYATNIKQMTMAHLHAGAVGSNGSIVAWAFNSTYGPISGSMKAFFTFNPSASNMHALLAAGLVYFNIHTIAHPAGELRGQLIGQGGNITYPSPPSPAPADYGYGTTSNGASAQGTAQVIIIGAGLSGLSAARLLTDAKVNTLVLEGQSVPGGRIRTRKLATQTYPAEEGANWIHGYSSSNPLYKLADDLGLSMVGDEENSYLWENGKLLQGDGSDYAPLEKVTSDFTAWMKKTLTKTDTRSIQDMVNLYISSKSLDTRSVQYLLKGVNGKIIQEESVPAHLLSARLYDFSEKFPGGDALFAGPLGTSAFVSGTITPPNGNVPLNIAYNKAVVAINYGDKDGLVKVRISDGSQYSAPYVICSASLGVLKSNTISFNPPLPKAKTKALAEMIMGNLERIVMVFPSNFWDPSNDLKAGWLSRLTADPSTSYWNEFYTPYAALERNVIIGWNAGSTAILSMNMTDDQLLQSALDALATMFPSVTIPKPLEFFTSRWTSNPFVLGAYSNVAASALTPPMEDLSSPLGSYSTGFLQFAGEHTSDTYYGTMQGALLSGQREAKWILGKIKSKEGDYDD